MNIVYYIFGYITLENIKIFTYVGHLMPITYVSHLIHVNMLLNVIFKWLEIKVVIFINLFNSSLTSDKRHNIICEFRRKHQY